MKSFNEKIQEKFNLLSQEGKLFRVRLTGDEIWDAYINSFSKEDDPIFRDPKSSVHNCNCCKNFIRRYGNIVAINENYEISTMFDVVTNDEFENTVKVLSSLIKSSEIVDIFFETYSELNSLPYEKCSKSNNIFKLGIESNNKIYTKEESEKFGVVQAWEIRTFNHFHLFLDKKFVDFSGRSIQSIMADYRDAKNVFQRAMQTIPLDTLELVVDLINQGSLLDGATHLYKVKQIIPLKKEYEQLPLEKRDNWCWVKSFNLPFAKFRNELIGVLCSEIAEGEELNKACESWNRRVDPSNYMKVTSPITKKQIEEARRFIEQNGYEESFNRRFAYMEDINVSEILHSNIGKGEIKLFSIFDNVKSTSTRHKRSEFNNVEEVGIEKFMEDILPNCTSVEVFLTNDHDGHMVSLTTSNVPESKPIFKWSNNYSWTFKGNLAGKTEIKENVKAAGGSITGVLRCSLQWNDNDTKGIVDLDLHCSSKKEHIYYVDKRPGISGGWLDVDMINPTGVGIENITWQDNIPDGEYLFYVNNFSQHRNHRGFKAEIEIDGNTFNYSHLKPFTSQVKIATVKVVKGVMSIEHHLPESTLSKKIYNLETFQFHKVNLICLSPNHWDKNKIGNKYYLFMLEGCKAENPVRSFHNENLIGDLLQHRKVMEVLGGSTMVQPSDRQLSGIGFNATVRNDLIVRLQGTHKRVLRIKF